MAVIWQKKKNNVHYEVRSAGRTRRLYTNGVFHSQYHPQRATAGGVWDLLMLPAFLRPEDALHRVLVLGVGGGAVIHLLQRQFPAVQITGVDLDPVHLQVATQHFGVSSATVELHCAEAQQWLQVYSGPPFDLIIEDLFGDQDGEPERAIAPSAGWINQLLRHLKRDGMLVMNFIGKPAFSSSGFFTSKQLNKRFKSVYDLRLPRYENIIIALSRTPVSARTLRTRLKNNPELCTAMWSGLLPYQIRKIK
ncbi:MAG TPA: methyltransferase domain-containing protein [Gammaproteobacteria bacterium]|nr:methyltransferase domain-containing protein [Gammaproteobacteria bacterium]